MTIFFSFVFSLALHSDQTQRQGQALQGLPSRTGRGQNAIFDRFFLIFREFRAVAGLPVMQSHFSQ